MARLIPPWQGATLCRRAEGHGDLQGVVIAEEFGAGRGGGMASPRIGQARPKPLNSRRIRPWQGRGHIEYLSPGTALGRISSSGDATRRWAIRTPFERRVE